MKVGFEDRVNKICFIVVFFCFYVRNVLIVIVVCIFELGGLFEYFLRFCIFVIFCVCKLIELDECVYFYFILYSVLFFVFFKFFIYYCIKSFWLVGDKCWMYYVFFCFWVDEKFELSWIKKFVIISLLINILRILNIFSIWYGGYDWDLWCVIVWVSGW